ncbi:HAMP domain-containing sensor histidine kinase [Desulfuromonas sp. AOP6]|uniref:ATP-binding protein n=1 Tax=Desulfuromonas sp. AOP6 TaxID=1566351 RepID=UPI0012769EF3|nr:HAMP domain-containing sensor histidine kinase [Desulfuromonas sp. AOP6]BCA79473.1 two-component sensor histidine kinase [Desulfuromonas sp. AOP6]
MALYQYVVGPDLRILSSRILQGTESADRVRPGAGLFYYHHIPRLLVDGDDAVSRVLATGESLTLQAFPFSCPHTTLPMDAQLDPLLDAEGGVAGVTISLHLHHECPYFHQSVECQHLIDLGKTASTLSHGVRNPLNAIKGAVVYLKDKYGNEKNLVEFTEIMEEEILRLEKFISGFLSTTFDDLEKRQVELNRILKKIETYTSLQIMSLPVSLSFRYGNVGSLRLNPFQVEHAILNVINNAISILKNGGHVSVETRLESKNGENFAVVEVVDDGPGMPDDIISSLSQPQICTASKSGKGFGLFLTREAMECHGGFLHIERLTPRGTSVKMGFPSETGDC